MATAAVTTTRPASKTLTLMFIFDSERVLLGLKKRGLGAGKFNGFGGKLEPGETVLEAAKRELEEEAGIRAIDPVFLGVVTNKFVSGEPDMCCHVFRADAWEGEIVETEEMAPQWFKQDEVPFEKMWKDDEHWFPHLIAKRPFNGVVLFEDYDTLLEATITPTVRDEEE